MCCFSRAVKYVGATKIFARLTDKGSQYLAYQMEYESSEPNAMILPIPIATPAREDSVKFIDLRGYEHFFSDLAKGFPVRPRRSAFGRAMPNAAIDSQKRLVVKRVGNFIASFVPHMKDFGRLDPQFSIPAEIWKQIPGYADYGFAVFQLANLAGRPHPMAFEFKTRLKKTFFPTVHIHDGEVHAYEDFDHDLYLQHAGYDSIVSAYHDHDKKDPATKLVRSKQKAAKFCDAEKAKGLVAPNLLVHKTSLHGQLANRDYTYSASGSATSPQLSTRNMSMLWPTSAAALGLGCFLRRRMRIRAEHAGAAKN